MSFVMMEGQEVREDEELQDAAKQPDAEIICRSNKVLIGIKFEHNMNPDGLFVLQSLPLS